MIKKKKEKNKISLNTLLSICLIIFTLFGGYFYLRNNNYNLKESYSIENFKEKKDEDLLKTAVSIAENFIKSFFMGDFEKAKIDFDEEMKTNFDISSLKNIQEQTIVKTGNLQELGKPIVNKKEDNFFIIEYPQAKSEKKEKIMIQVVFKNDSENNLKISGFWFDSPDDLWKEE